MGAYYPEGLNPVKIYVEEQDVRAVKGGMGMAKTGGNYAASLRAGDQAEKAGYSQVLWLDGGPLNGGELVVELLGDLANLVVGDGDFLSAHGQLADGGDYSGGAAGGPADGGVLHLPHLPVCLLHRPGGGGGGGGAAGHRPS